jgi:hypothetical protein
VSSAGDQIWFTHAGCRPQEIV